MPKSQPLLLLAIALLSGCAQRHLAFDTPPAPPAKPPKQMPAGDQPDKAAEFQLLRRTGNPQGVLPLERYEAARQKLTRMPAYNLAAARPAAKGPRQAADLGGWESLGPANQGGRTRVLVIHPQDPKIMYAAAATGGVWKTTDAGENWAPLTDLFPTLGLGALTMDPATPDTLYAGTGNWFNSLSGTNVLGSAPLGTGIFRTRDAGQSWEPLPAPAGPHFRYINDIIVSRSDSNRIYAATWTGIFRSTDSGATWTQIFNRGTNGRNGCQDMVMRTDQSTDYFYAACGTTAAGDAAIFRNADAASDAPWEKVLQLPAMGNTTLALAPSSQSTIYALIASNGADSADWRNSLHAVYRSTTNGDPDTWEPRTTNQNPEQINTGLLSTNQGFYNNLCTANGQRSIGGQGWIHNAITVDPTNPDRVWVGGIDIYRSDDGGANWGIASFWQSADSPGGAHADVSALIFPPDYNPATKPHLFTATDGGVYKTENANADLATGPRAGCTPFQNKVAWKPLHNGYVSTQFYTGTVSPGGGSFFGGKQDNGTMRGTLAAGREWTRISGGDGAAVAIDPRDVNTIYVSTPNFSLRRSRNGGKTFTTTIRGITEPAANFSFVAPLGMDPRNPDTLYAGGRIFWRSNNQGDTWEPLSTQLPTNQGTVSAIAVSPVDGSVLMATSTGFILRTANIAEATAETEWIATRPRLGYIPSIEFDPITPGTVYAAYSQFNTAAGQSHIYRSTDGGATWTGVDGSGDTGIPDIPVFRVLIDPSDPQRLFAGTDLGVFVSLDSGATWNRDANPFAAVPTEALALDKSAGANHLYAFTFGRGVWRTRLPGSGDGCAYSIGSLPNLPAFGGTFSIPINTAPNCAWSAVPQTGAIDVNSPAQGAGDGAITVTATPNTAQTARRGGLWLQDKTIEATQAGALQAPPAADSRSGAAEVTALPYLGVRDTRTQTIEPTDPRASCAATAPAKTVWWRVTVPANAQQLEVIFQGQRYDTFGNSGVIVAAYPANGLSIGPELACASLSRNTFAWNWGTTTFPVTPGAAYYIMASATGLASTDGGYTILGVRVLP